MKQETKTQRPVHPFWCDECGQKAPFTITGCGIAHRAECSRHDEDPYEVFDAAVEWCKKTGDSIP